MNAADGAALQATYDHDDNAETEELEIADIASECAGPCVLGGSTDEDNCVVDCIREDTADAVSVECADCFEHSVFCAAVNCLAPCLPPNQDSEACIACRCGDNNAGENCVQVFTDCSGVPSDTCG